LRLRVLGWLAVGEPPQRITAPREQVILAALLANANDVVHVDYLIRAVWHGEPPKTAAHQVQSCVARLRRTLLDVGVAGLIATERVGYRAVVDPADLDALVFSREIALARARAVAGDLAGARTRYRAGLELWRGPALAGVPGDVIGACAARLEEQRATAIDECIDVELQLGLAGDLIGELTELVSQYPYRERLRGQLMIAFTRTGRRADALALYDEGRRRLADDLGVEPGDRLNALHVQILRGELDLNAGSTDAASGRPRAPHSLPSPVHELTGRDVEIRRLLKCVPDHPADGPARATIEVVDGMPGVGKTALALKVADLVSDRYPDGQLFLDLHGHDEQAPVTPDDALDLLLRQLGVAPDRIPADLDGRAALWRTELSDRCLVVLLDNAASSSQVGPILPGPTRSFLLITSRRRLVGLDQVRPLSLEPLTDSDGLRLLRHAIGERVDADETAATELVRRCGGVPLAIKLAGARLLHRPAWRVADLVEILRHGSTVADLNVEGRSLGTVFDCSYRDVDPYARRVYRCLGLHPAGVVTVDAVAAAADLPNGEAAAALERLVDANLVESPAAHRYRLHDLLRAYAADRAAAELDEPERTSTLRRLCDWYLYTTAAATRHLEAPGPRLGLDVAHQAPWRTRFPDAAEAIAWLDEQWRNVAALADLADELGWQREVCLFPRALWAFMFRRGLNSTSIRLHRRALVAVATLDDPRLEANTHRLIASAYARQGNTAEALRHLRQARIIAHECGDVLGEAQVLSSLASMYVRIGEFAAALESIEACADAAYRAGGVDMFTPIMLTLGHLLRMLGRYDEALAVNRLQLAAAIDTDRPDHYALALAEIGRVHLTLGHLRVAPAILQRAYERSTAAGMAFGAAEILSDMGTAHRRAGRWADAIGCQRDALRRMREFDDPAGKCIVGNDLARTLQWAGDHDAARGLYHLVLADAERIGDRYELARARSGIAEVHGR
jgi:DNA-binding SARP family transcriptional activator